MGNKRLGETTKDIAPASARAEASAPSGPALVVVWAAVDPHRLGEVLPIAAETSFGRGDSLARQRPNRTDSSEPIDNPYLSRRHITVVRAEGELKVTCHGKRKLRHRGATFDEIIVGEGDVFGIDGLYSFLVADRPGALPAVRAPSEHAFGEPDAHGIVGEGPTTWALRDQIAFVAGRTGHVLVTGPSGAGKELVARALHAASPRKSKELVSRSAATFPTGIIDAELFGNLANYPNAGTPERRGLVGEADGSTLFLDEIGELAPELQSRLLRVLDEHGEYQRLGESQKRHSDFRFVGATNRPEASIKDDLRARLAFHIDVPGLDGRREDIPLLARHLLVRKAQTDALVRDRFVEWNNGKATPRISQNLMEALVLQDWSTHVRELDRILWQSIASSPGRTLELTESVSKMIHARTVEAPDLDEQTVRAAFEKHGGVKEKVWRELGLPSRHALHRLLKKLDLDL